MKIVKSSSNTVEVLLNPEEVRHWLVASAYGKGSGNANVIKQNLRTDAMAFAEQHDCKHIIIGAGKADDGHVLETMSNTPTNQGGSMRPYWTTNKAGPTPANKTQKRTDNHMAKTRLEILQSRLPRGWGVATYSPGDGQTRYRFYEGPPGESYFAVKGEHTALGHKAAEAFAESLHQGAAAKVYKIVRRFERGGNRMIKRNQTLAQAQAHCNNPETNSNTARSAEANVRTKQQGPWWDGYEFQ